MPADPKETAMCGNISVQAIAFGNWTKEFIKIKKSLLEFRATLNDRKKASTAVVVNPQKKQPARQRHNEL
ncbi:hypothetical protein AB205_0045870, partial [Aquarana catesbeiana]